VKLVPDILKVEPMTFTAAPWNALFASNTEFSMII
jgi:hypothetical protein